MYITIALLFVVILSKKGKVLSSNWCIYYVGAKAKVR